MLPRSLLPNRAKTERRKNRRTGNSRRNKAGIIANDIYCHETNETDIVCSPKNIFLFRIDGRGSQNGGGNSYNGIISQTVNKPWYETLEELLQCPVCLDISSGAKIQCINGHHICASCRGQLIECPMCKSCFINTRNLAVEHITAKLKDIKVSIINPYHDINKRLVHNKVCVATQTEDFTKPSTSSACQTELTDQVNSNINNKHHKPLINLAPRIGKGSYPCRIGSCTKHLPHGRIIGHLRYHHKNFFYEFNLRDTMFKQNWTLDYMKNQDNDFALQVKEMGLFFLNVSIHQDGHLTASLQIVNCVLVARQFTYTLEVGNKQHSCSYTGLVKSCRINKELILQDCLNVHGTAMHHIINRNSFHCNLTIKRKPDNRGQDNPVQSSNALSEC